MRALKAHVRNGHFVIDERTDLPEGTELDLQLVKVTDAFTDMAPEDRDELEEAIEEGFRDFENGDHIRRRVDEIEADTAELEDWEIVRARLEAAS